VYEHFATLLSYPAPDIWRSLEGTIKAASRELPEAAELLESFRESAVALGPAALEELYIKTFEMRADSAPYAGHQIFGEDWRRGIFMAGLRARYGALGISEGQELPDHLSVVLRYLEALEPGPEKDEMIGDCIAPAVRKVLQAIGDQSPYGHVLDALRLCIMPPCGDESEFEETSCRPSSLSLFPILP